MTLALIGLARPRNRDFECYEDVAPTIVPASIIMGAMESLLIITGTMGRAKPLSLGSLSAII
jgi:hypothetical protein